MKTAITTTLLTLALLVISTLPGNAQQNKKAVVKTLNTSGYAPVNGLKVYYEVHGEGRPLVLLHGAYMTIPLNWSELLPELSKKHKVIALEMQGHGRTADTDRPYSYEGMADDVAGVLKHLKIDSADVLGYSLGGTIAFQMAIKYPAMVSKLIVVSTVFRYNGWVPEVLAVLKSIKPEFFEQTPLKTQYDSLAPDPKHWNAFVNKLATFDQQDYDLGVDKIRAIKSPTLLIMGDNDGVELAHKAEMYKALGGGVSGDMAGIPKSQLAIVPGTSHVGLMMQTKALLEIIQPFLAGINSGQGGFHQQ